MEKNKLKDSLKRLETIIKWFDEQEEIDVEAALEFVKEGAGLIKESRERLKKLENKFEEVKKGLGQDTEGD
jgi:exodeoxyribonuclease VII small subunit